MTEPLKLDAKEMSRILGRHLFELEHSPICSNFQTKNLQECDLISVSPAGYLFEFEMKTSVSDFKADFKKEAKHKRLKLKEGVYYPPKAKSSDQRTEFLLCSYFWYVCPACLIRDDMIPEYAGLIWVHYDGRLEYRVQAPMIHNIKADARIVRKIAHNLTQKHLFGSSYITFAQKAGDAPKVIKPMVLSEAKAPVKLERKGRQLVSKRLLPAIKKKNK